MAADGKASDILGTKPHQQGLLGVYLSSFYNSNDTNTASSAVKLDLEDLVAGLMVDGSAVIPRIMLDGKEDDDAEDSKGDEFAISGIALIRDFALTGHIAEDAMGGYLWFLENAAGTQIAIDVDEGHLTFLTTKSKAGARFYENDGKLHCHVTLKAEGSIEGAVFLKDRLFDAEVLTAHENAFAAKIHEELADIFYAFQEAGVDGLGLHELIRKHRWALYQRFDNWPQAFAEMIFTADVDVKIHNTGAVK